MTAAAQLGKFDPAIVNVTATAGASAAVATGAISTAWVPVIGPALAAVTIGLTALFNRKSGRQKVAATEIVDQLEPFMRQNLAAYREGPRTRADQAQALKNFDDAFAWLQSAEACGNKELADAGKRCISERSPGGKWDWHAYYRDPIANDPDVRPDALTSAAQFFDVGGQDAGKWLAAAALAALVMAL